MKSYIWTGVPFASTPPRTSKHLAVLPLGWIATANPFAGGGKPPLGQNLDTRNIRVSMLRASTKYYSRHFIPNVRTWAREQRWCWWRGGRRRETRRRLLEDGKTGFIVAQVASTKTIVLLTSGLCWDVSVKYHESTTHNWTLRLDTDSSVQTRRVNADVVVVILDGFDGETIAKRFVSELTSP